jgi:SPP1 gp7 family putative phage head morphogenesis protein
MAGQHAYERETEAVADDLEAVLYVELDRIRSAAIRRLGAGPRLRRLPGLDQWERAFRDHARLALALGCGIGAGEVRRATRGRGWSEVGLVARFDDDDDDDEAAQELKREWQQPRIGRTHLGKPLEARVKRLSQSDREGLALVPRAALDAADQYSMKLAGEIAEATMAKVQEIIGQGLADGMSGRAIARALEAEQLPDDAGEGWPRHRLSRIVRTETMRHLSAGELVATFASEAVEGWRYSAILDMRTSDLCRGIDGLFISKTALAEGMFGCPPFHPHCRTIMVPSFAWQKLGEQVDWENLPDGASLTEIRGTKMGTVDVPLQEVPRAA